MKRLNLVPVLVLLVASTVTITSTVRAEDPTPQGSVVCTGWHALCSLATDCKMVSDTQANCNCWKVNEQHVVVTADITDQDARTATLAACTSATPCDVDEAPVCGIIKSGDYTVNEVKYKWISTYSYRGWCKNWKPKACAAGPWADCMTYPCTESTNPKDPDRPLVCQCKVNTTPFVGSNGRCKTKKGRVMSTINITLWDFQEKKFRPDMPGYEFVQGACAPIHSDSEG